MNRTTTDFDFISGFHGEGQTLRELMVRRLGKDNADFVMKRFSELVEECLGDVPHCDDNCQKKKFSHNTTVHDAAIDGQQHLWEEIRQRFAERGIEIK